MWITWPKPQHYQIPLGASYGLQLSISNPLQDLKPCEGGEPGHVSACIEALQVGENPAISISWQAQAEWERNGTAMDPIYIARETA